MIRSRRSISRSSFLVVAIVAFTASCGSSNSSHDLSQAQAQAVSQEVITALQSALTAAFSAGASVPSQPHSLASVVRHATTTQPSDCTSNPNGYTCDIPVSYTGSCPGGGTISVTGAFNFTLNTSGDGSDSTTLTVTPASCSVSNLTINGNPDVTVATQIQIQDDAPAYPITLTEGGGISYGPNPTGSCSINATMSINSATSCTITGTICGQSINGSC
jgi:uncharacterized protein (DUF3084 family)